MQNLTYTIPQYGRIELYLKEIMDRQNLTRNAVARAIDTRFEVVNKWYNGSVEKIDADILARLCYVLNCEAGDLIKYVPPEESDRKSVV